MYNTIGKLLAKLIACNVANCFEQHHRFPHTLRVHRSNKETCINAGVFTNDVFEGFRACDEILARCSDLYRQISRASSSVFLGHSSHLRVAEQFRKPAGYFRLEVMAVAKACRWLKSQDYSNAYVQSDWMSMVRKMQTCLMSRIWLESVQKSTIGSVTLICVPSHAGLRGNKRGSRLTGLVTISESQSFYHTDIIKNIRILEELRTLEEVSRHRYRGHMS